MRANVHAANGWFVSEPAVEPSRSTTSAATPGSVWATHAALFIVQVAFASQSVEAKIAMAPRALGGEALSPWAIAMARMLGATLFFQIVTRLAGWLRTTTWRDQWKLAVFSILGIALNQTLFLLGLRLTNPMSAALLMVTIPVLGAGMALLLGQERLSARLVIGIVVALSGVAWLTGVHSVDRGAIVVLGNCIAYAAYIVFSRETIRRLGALTVITWVFTWGAILFAPLGALPLVNGMATFTPRGWLFLSYIVVVPTIVAYLANAWALGRSNAALVTVYIYLQPLITALLAWIQLDQTPTPKMLFAGLLIVAGVALVASRRPAQSITSEEFSPDA